MGLSELQTGFSPRGTVNRHHSALALVVKQERFLLLNESVMCTLVQQSAADITAAVPRPTR